MLTAKSNSDLIISNSKFTIEINHHSGFCFGVVNAIDKAEELLNDNSKLYVVGSIVHNKQEVTRLSQKGMEVINTSQIKSLKNKKILFRAHGEPPESYKLAKKSENELIDATCPVVLKLQQRIKEAYISSFNNDGQVVIYGKKNHAEVIGLLGQTEYNAILIESMDDVSKIDFTRPVELFSQTTKPLDKYNEIASYIREVAQNSVIVNDTVCRQVSNRQQQLSDFSKKFDVVYFVGDPESSNSKLLFSVCKQANQESFFITKSDDIDDLQMLNKSKIGICGATSTPLWLMKDVAVFIEKTLL